MKTLISPNLPPPILLPSHLTTKPLLHLPSSSKCTSSTRLYANTRGRGFSGRPTKQDAPPTTTKPPSTGGDEEEELSPVVINRIIGRVLIYVGVPMAAGLGTLQLYSVLKDNQIWEPPLWLTFLTSILTFGGSALGVPFGALSASWDPDQKGSPLGLKEANQNWDQIWSEDAD